MAMITVVGDAPDPLRSLNGELLVALWTFPFAAGISDILAQFIHAENKARQKECRYQHKVQDRHKDRDKCHGHQESESFERISGAFFFVEVYLCDGGSSHR